MSTTYTWTINNMFTLQTPDPDYVVNVLWTLTGVDGTTTASIGGNTMFDSNQSGTFIPYDQLTEAIVVGWVQTSLGKDTVEASLQSQINAQINPVQESGVPWA